MKLTLLTLPCLAPLAAAQIVLDPQCVGETPATVAQWGFNNADGDYYNPDYTIDCVDGGDWWRNGISHSLPTTPVDPYDPAGGRFVCTQGWGSAGSTPGYDYRWYVDATFTENGGDITGFNFDYYNYNVNAPDNYVVAVEQLVGGSWTEIHVTPELTLGPATGVWQQAFVDFRDPVTDLVDPDLANIQANDSYRFSFMGYNGADVTGATIGFDNIRIDARCVDCIPEPGTALLAGLFGTLLTFGRRRRS